MPNDALVLGPLLRYVDETSAAVWVETADAGSVTVRMADRTWSAPTFRVHGHHYALVEVSGLEPGSITPYEVEVDERQAPVVGADQDEGRAGHRLDHPEPPGEPLRERSLARAQIAGQHQEVAGRSQAGDLGSQGAGVVDRRGGQVDHRPVTGDTPWPGPGRLASGRPGRLRP